MNEKHITGIIAIVAVCIGGFVSYKAYNEHTEHPTIEQCTISNPVGCDALIEEATKKRKEEETNKENLIRKIVERQVEISKKADVYRSIKKLNKTQTTTGDYETPKEEVKQEPSFQ